MSVAAAVVSFNTRGLLRDCLVSLREQIARVVVVDNGSTDGSWEMVRDEFPDVELLTPPENLGFGRAVNLAARHVGEPWLAVANADTAAEPGAVDRLLAAGERAGQAAVIAPRLILPDGATQHSVHPFPTIAFTAAFNAGVTHLAADRLCLVGGWDPERPREVPWAIGAFLLVRRTAFDAVGGFDERQWLYAEDLDLAWRLRRAGWRTLYEPGARVLHDASASTSAVFGEGRIEREQRAAYAWLYRRRGLTVTRTIAAMNVAGARVRSTIGPAHRRAAQRQWASIHRRTGFTSPADLRRVH
jgi:GT2 family glycosyltransferase